METEASIYIIRRRYYFVFLELVKCLAISILASTLITLPFMHFLARVINYKFIYFGDNRDLLLEVIPAIILCFVSFFFLFFKKRIKNINSNILNYVEKELAQKIKQHASDKSNLRKIINEIKVHRFD